MTEHRRSDRALTVSARFTFVNRDFHNWLEQRFPEFGFVYDGDAVYIVLVAPPILATTRAAEAEIPPPLYFPKTDLFSLYLVEPGNPACKQQWATSLLLDFAAETLVSRQLTP